MSRIEAIASAIATAGSWEQRIRLIRSVPEEFGTAQHADAYAAIAEQAYRSSVEADFAYVHWRDEYELPTVERAYNAAFASTSGFSSVDTNTLAAALLADPATLRVFRLLLGFTIPEFVELCALVSSEARDQPISKGVVTAAETGKSISETLASAFARAIDGAMSGALFPPPPSQLHLRRKLDKPDTAGGWRTVRQYARQGVPLAVFLHQRLYGGAFRQLLDATSSKRGDFLEDRVQELLTARRVPFIRTGSSDQPEIKRRFGLTVRPSPDFVIFAERTEHLLAILECKVANDGGTARDKAARFRSLRVEANRLGGVPVIAVLGGIGWRRTRDALGPVVRDTDGRTFTIATLQHMMEIDPFSRFDTGN